MEIWLSTALLAGLCGAVAAVPAAGSPGSKRVATCSFSEHRLTVNANDRQTVVSVRRQGERLEVSHNGAQVNCGGAAATVHNVNIVTVNSRTEFDVDLRGGPFAPGFTDEGDGSSEIEIQAKFGRTGGLRVLGTRRADKIAMGDSLGFPAVDLNAGERKRDADVFVQGGFPIISVISGLGKDRITARGGRGFESPLSWRTTISSGAGRDRITGGPKHDLIGSGAGADRINPGKGPDRIKSLGGVDRLRLRDGERDYARCGPGADKVKADRKDRLSGCDTR